MQTDDEPFPPAPGSSSVPQRSPTPAAPPPRQDMSPESPISGPLSPVRHEEPGKLAKSVLAEALNPPPGESLSGQSVSLFDAQTQIHAQNVANFLSEEEVTNRAVGRLQDAGFEVGREYFREKSEDLKLHKNIVA